MGILFRRLVLVSIFASIAAHAKVEPKEFIGWFNDYYKTHSSLAREVREKSAQFRYVFINGFLNEVTQKSYLDVQKTLRDQGVRASAIHILRPSSVNSVEQNLSWITTELKKLADLGPEKLVLVGHSKGAAETLAVALAAPADLQDKIQTIFLVQGAFHGSPIADFFLNEGVPLDDRLPFAVRLMLMNIQSADLPTRLKNAETWLGFTVDQGLLSLTKRATESFWKDYLERKAETISVVGAKTYYVLGHQAPTQTRWAFMAPGYYMDVYYGANDGVIPRSHQYLRGVGTPLVDLTMDHVDLSSENPRTASALALRDAFAKAVMTTVAHEAK